MKQPWYYRSMTHVYAAKAICAVMQHVDKDKHPDAWHKLDDIWRKESRKALDIMQAHIRKVTKWS